MINEKLHSQFHDLAGHIGSVSAFSQVCAAYVARFNLEKLEGRFKAEITNNFQKILSYYDVVMKDLKKVIFGLNEIDEKTHAKDLQNNILFEIEKLKDIEEKAGILFDRLKEDDNKENLIAFKDEVSKIPQLCIRMSEIINALKDKLTALGKY